MDIAIKLLVGFVAVQHIGFLLLEMFFWTKPLGQKVFKLKPGFAKESAVLAANQGLYNGFLAAGLLWSLFAGHASAAFSLQVFFLSCVLVAGVYGGYSVGKTILLVQALPAAMGLIFLFVAGDPRGFCLF